LHSTIFCFRFAEELNCNAMNLENTKAQMRKGVLEFCILSLLSGKEAYASELIQTLKDSKLLVVEGTIYPLLTRLKNDGLLTYRWEESTSGPPRKYYTVTDPGEKFLSELRSTWDELVRAVEKTTRPQ
jgi:PadR family transcriptional regulator, regulatory protein PadR